MLKTDFIDKTLEDLKNNAIYRSLKNVDSPQEREIVLGNRRVLNFASNDYLGLANDPRIKVAVLGAMERYGFGSGAARLICGNMTPHEALEADLAVFKNTESALLYSCGYMANVGIIQALADRHTLVLSDKLNHASIVDGSVLSRAQLGRYPHKDMAALEMMLKRSLPKQRRLIVTDTVFSMDGDTAPLADIVDLARRYEALVMVDEAHAFGVLGTHGGGLVEELNLGPAIDVQMGTLSKAAGSFGAYACTSKSLREYLINTSRSFIYTTAMPPAWAVASQAALKIVAQAFEERQRLHAHAEYLRAQAQAMGFDTLYATTPIIPLIVKEARQAVIMAQALLTQGIFVQAIRPPTVPVGSARLRLTVTAGHTRADVECLLNALRRL